MCALKVAANDADTSSRLRPSRWSGKAKSHLSQAIAKSAPRRASLPSEQHGQLTDGPSKASRSSSASNAKPAASAVNASIASSGIRVMVNLVCDHGGERGAALDARRRLGLKKSTRKFKSLCPL